MEGHRYADDSEPGWYSGAQYARSSDPDVSGSQATRPYESGVQERPSGAFRLPEQRPMVEQRPESRAEQRPESRAEQRPEQRAEPRQDQRIEQRPYGMPGDPYATTDPLSTTGSHARPAESAMPAPYESGRITARGPEYPTIRPTGAPAPAGEAQITPVRKDEVPTTLVPPVALGRPKKKVYGSSRPVSALIVGAVMVVLLVPVVRLLLDATFAGTPSAHAIVPAVLLASGFALTAVGLFAVTGGGPITRESWLRMPVAYLPAGLIMLLAAGLAAA